MNIVGGIRPEGTYTDLAVAMAIYSSYSGVTMDSKTLVLGEIGLTGDLRAVHNGDKIIKEAERLGFKKIIMPIKNVERTRVSSDNIQLGGVRNIRELK